MDKKMTLALVDVIVREVQGHQSTVCATSYFAGCHAQAVKDREAINRLKTAEVYPTVETALAALKAAKIRE